MMNAIRWIKQFAEKKSRQSVSRLSDLKETKVLAKVLVRYCILNFI